VDCLAKKANPSSDRANPTVEMRYKFFGGKDCALISIKGIKQNKKTRIFYFST
jgi:hypothetical protein